jgi:hypothetical protein
MIYYGRKKQFYSIGPPNTSLLTKMCNKKIC